MGHHHSDRQQSPHHALAMDDKDRHIAGRIGVVTGLSVFLGAYAYGIAEYGPLLGIALGWLPCGALGWGTTVLVASAGARLAKHARKTFLRPSSFPVASVKPRAGAHHK